MKSKSLIFCHNLVILHKAHHLDLFQGGLTEIESIMERTTDLDAAQYAALLQPFSVCADWLSRSRVQSTVAPIIERAVTYVRELSDEEFKLKVECSHVLYINLFALLEMILYNNTHCVGRWFPTFLILFPFSRYSNLFRFYKI